jgi:uncharacterized protein YjbI with pentapeptide repeats
MKIFNLSGILIYSDDQPVKGASLKSLNLFCPDFEKKEMTGIDLSGAKLSSASFDSSILHHANFRRAEIEGGLLTDCQLDNANLSEVMLYEVNAYRASFRGADLTKGQFLGCEFTNADFTDANLCGSFFGPDNILHKTRFYGAQLADTRLFGAIFKDVVYDDEMTFPVGFEPSANGFIKTE